MNASRNLWSFSALLAMGVLSSVGRAQVLTADTITGQAVDNGWYLNAGTAHTQTFTGVSQLNLVTFRFIAVSTDTAFIPEMDIPFVVTSWSGSQSDGMLVTSGVFTVGAGASWNVTGNILDYFDSSFDFGGLALIPATVYGISLIGGSDSNGRVGIGFTNNVSDALYASGSGYQDSSVSSPYQNSLMAGNSALGYDFSFSATSASPVPEASTAAVLFAGMFVGGLMVRRRRRESVDSASALPVAQG